ncbi:hypothetical protein MHU86_4346 [Fragilaria crotonensis]|nr:hypothetical protein MHU86_4346 [Fragilaria crotonensis]
MLLQRLLLVACFSFLPFIVSGFQHHVSVSLLTRINSALLSTMPSSVTESKSIATFPHEDEESCQQQRQEDSNSPLKLTPMQIKTLRKEVIKRQARNGIAKVFLSELETMGPFSKDTIESIVSLLKAHELVEVRGIARIRDEDHNTKHVHGISELLQIELNRSLPAERVVTKGIRPCSSQAVVVVVVEMRLELSPIMTTRMMMPLGLLEN